MSLLLLGYGLAAGRYALICLSTGSLYTYGLARVFELAAQAGFDGIEVLVDHRWDSRDPRYLRRLSAEHGLPIVALHNPFVRDVPGWPSDELGRLERTVALAQKLGVSLIVTHLPLRLYGIVAQWHGSRSRRFLLPVPWSRRGAYYDLLRNDGLAEIEAASGLTIAVENMPDRRFLGFSLPLYWFNHPDKLSRFPHLTLDTTHLGTWGLDPLAVYGKLKGRVAHVHLSNYDGKEHRSPPHGRLPLDVLLHQLAGDGFAGVVSVECAPDALHAEDEERCRAALQRALAFCRRHLRHGDLSPGSAV